MTVARRLKSYRHLRLRQRCRHWQPPDQGREIRGQQFPQHFFEVVGLRRHEDRAVAQQQHADRFFKSDGGVMPAQNKE